MRALAGSAYAVVLEGGAVGAVRDFVRVFTSAAEESGAAVTVFRATRETTAVELAAVRGLFGAEESRNPAGRARELLAEGPLAVVVEDAQWCDPASLRLLASLLHGARRRALFLLLTRGASGRAPADHELAAIASHRRCRILAVPGEGPGAEQPIGSGPVDAVRTAAAVLGSADPVLISRLAEVPLPKVRSMLRALDPVTVGAVEPARSAVLAAVSGRETARLRVRAARLLNDAGRPAREIAEHLTASPRLAEPWMGGVLRDAAEVVRGEGDRVTATRYLERAVEACPERWEPRLALARNLVATDPAAALAELDRTNGEDGAPGRTVSALYALAAGLAEPPREAVRLARTRRRAQGAVVGSVTDRASLPAGTLAALCAHHVEARHLLASRVGEYRADGTSPAAGHATVERLLAQAFAGRNPETVAATARGVLRHTRTASCPTLLSLGAILQLAEDVPNSLRALDLAVAEAVVDDDLGMTCQVIGARAQVLRDSGNPGAALLDARAAALVLATRTGTARPMGLASITVGAGLYYTGEPAAAERVLRQAQRGEDAFSPWVRHVRLLWLARVAVLRGDAKTALAMLDDCAWRNEEQGVTNPVLAPWWYEAALLLSDLGRLGEAAGYAERGRALARSWPTAKARGLVLLAEGVSTAGTAGIELLEEAGRVLATSVSRTEYARSEYLLGRALLRREDRTAARGHLRQAALLAQACGWDTLAGLAREALGVAGGRMRTGASRTSLLTGREREVAELAAQGATNRAVASTLFISARTVELHLTNVYRKLAVDSRAELAAALRADDFAPPAVAGIRAAS
jgi:DNA-binding CsgD family transcriptional regulator